MKQIARILGTSPRPQPAQATLLMLKAGICGAALAASSLLTGCGLKGPLYLPAPGATPPSAASAPSTP
ncbi:MAG: LPS translocon maturation chaperone LptM [Acidobacteriota bacterium]